MNTTTGIPALDRVLHLVGAVYTILTLILPFVPQNSKVAVALARIVGDLRNIVGRNAASEACKDCSHVDAADKTDPPPPVVPTAALVLAVIFAGHLTACSSAPAVVPVVVDLTQAICVELAKDAQNEPEYIKFACSVINALNAPPVIVKVPAQMAPSFKSAHSSRLIEVKK